MKTTEMSSQDNKMSVVEISKKSIVERIPSQDEIELLYHLLSGEFDFSDLGEADFYPNEF